MSAPKKVDPYGFAPTFERAVVAYACTQAAFYGRVGRIVDPEALGDPRAKLAIKAAHEVAKDQGTGPGSSAILLQRLRRWMGEGKVTLEQVLAVGALLDEHEDDAAAPDSESVIAELVPVLRRRMESDALRAGMDVYARRTDTGKVIDMFDAARRLGQNDRGTGVRLGKASFGVIETAGRPEVLSTGVTELDEIIDGGLPRGEFGLLSMSTGGGKSITLCHFAGHAVWTGRHVAIATLEIPEYMWLARLKSNLTGVPISSIIDNDKDRARCAAKLEEIAPQLGICHVKYFTPGATTIDDLRDWRKDVEDEAGQALEVMIVDYLDEVTVAPSAAGKEIPGHERVKKVYRAFSSFVLNELRGWGWSASQPKGAASGSKRKRIDTDDLADGMGKARVADKLITAFVDDAQTSIEFFVGKNRTGAGRKSTGPIPVDFACGAVAPIVRAPRKLVDPVPFDVPLGAVGGREPGED